MDYRDIVTEQFIFPLSPDSEVVGMRSILLCKSAQILRRAIEHNKVSR